MEKGLMTIVVLLSASRAGSGSLLKDRAARAAQDTPPDVTVRACLGQNVTLPGDGGGVSLKPSSDAGQGQTVISVGWLKHDGDKETMLAVNTSGHFLSSLGSRRASLLHVPDKGVTLPEVREADLGRYTVRVRSVRDGVLRVQDTQLVLEQQDDIRLGGDDVQIHLADDVIYDPSTDEWHVQIKCGRFLSADKDHVAVTWRTPSNQLLNSTRSDDGHFVLHVPNPVEQGVYSCLLHTDHCRNKQSVSGNAAASVYVDSVEQRLRVLEVGLSSARCSSEQCTPQPEQQQQQQRQQQQQEETSSTPQPPPSGDGGVVRQGDYTLAFRLTPGIGQSSYDTYTKVGHNDDDPLVRRVLPAGCLTVDGSLPCDRHYRSKVLDLWDRLRVEKARVAVYVNRSEVAFFEFNAVGSDYINWFQKERLASSSYTDLFTEPKNFCSVKAYNIYRRFYVSRNHGGCAVDRGWLIVWDTADTCRPVWGADPPYPVIGYMHGNTNQLWTSQYVRHADVLAIWVKMASDGAGG
ncbi:uncharacterized protein LOC143295821 [Babylonia areolata]|uniref:uncharacterized protein LOC143295821 n=1 Tax=Babylonia areolata TaxID=304850 RepID=UPI003FD23595